MNDNLKDRLKFALDLTMKAGADKCDVLLSKSESFSLSAQNQEIDKYKISGSQALGIRVIKNQKVGLSYSEALDNESLMTAAKFATENALASQENIFENINVKEGEFLHPCEFEKDESSTEDKIEFCLALEDEVKKREKRVQAVPYNGFSEVNSSQYYLNSFGVFTYTSEYYQSCYTSALLQDKDKSSMHYHSVLGRNLKQLNLEECVTESLEHACQWLDAGPLETGQYDIIFTSDAFSELLGCFSNIFSGKSAMEKTNPFGDKVGESLFSPKLSIKDIPQYKDAFTQSYCDSEGLPHKELQLVEEGVLKSFYHNTATANFFKTETTAHAYRGAKSGLGVAGTIKVISPGELSELEIQSGQFFEIHALDGLHSGANAISGDFSFAARGYLCRDGKRVAPVKGVTVSGNFHHMLKQVQLVGDQVMATTHKDFFTPKLRFENMDVAGK